jgi:hypothetical protein
VSNLAGVAVANNTGLIYVMHRNTADLLAFSFDEENNTLLPEGTWHLNPAPGYTNIYGIGLALDGSANLLYVTSTYYPQNKVHIYNTGDFTGGGGDIDPNGYIDIIVGSTPRQAVAIAVDPVRRYMYTCAFNGSDAYHNYLVRTGLDSPHTSIEQLISSQYAGIGVAVDAESGYVYVTTENDQFRVYGSGLGAPRDTETAGITDPAGVAVGGWYKHQYFSIAKDNNDVAGQCVLPWDANQQNYLTFDICWDANGHGDDNGRVIDKLPLACDYYSSYPPADYNWMTRTVT